MLIFKFFLTPFVTKFCGSQRLAALSARKTFALFSILPRRDNTQLKESGPEFTKSIQAPFLKKTSAQPSLIWNSIFQQDEVNQCNYFCYVAYYWMETDPNYEFEAPKWFDFTADFEDEFNEDSKWVKQTYISHPNVWMYSFVLYTIRVMLVN